MPEFSLSSLIKRGLVRIEEEPEVFALGGVGAAGKKHAHEHVLNEEQMEAVGTIAAAMAKGGFRPYLLYGVTGSGKTAVYFAAMRPSAGRGEERAAAGAGDRVDAGDGGADVCGIRR